MNHESLQQYTLAGSPIEQGRAYGEQCRVNFSLSFERWDALIREDGLDPGVWAIMLGSFPGFLAAIERWAPHYREFSLGTAEALGVPWYRLLALWHMDEDWWIRPLVKSQPRTGLPRLERCTTLAGPAEGGSVAAQNMDVGSYTDGTQVVLKLEDTGPAGDVWYFAAGGPPLCGVNAAGVSLGMNTISELECHYDGLPVAAVMFETLFQASIDDAITFLRGIRHASGQGYTLTDAERTVSLEAGGERAVELPAAHAAGLFYRTNHAMADGAPVDPERLRNLETTSTTRERLAQVQARLADSKTLSVALAIETLACKDDPQHPVSRQENNGHSAIGFTAGSLVYDLRPDRIDFHVAPGPPCSTGFRTFRVK